MAVYSVIFFLAQALFHQALSGNSCKEQHRSEFGFALVKHVYHSFSTDHLFACVIACNAQPPCQSLNYNLADEICQFNNNTKAFRPRYFVKKASSVYADNPYSESASWHKLNTAPVCFGAKDGQFGKLEIEIGGSVKAARLVHASGEVTCNFRAGVQAWSKFGCYKTRKEVYTVITTSNNDILLPESQKSVYTLPGHYADSDEIAFAEISTPLVLSSGQELRIWYGEDLTNAGERDNDGSSCVDVYAKYM